MGCGSGHESIKLAKSGVQVIGIDFSEECIRVARERCPGCCFEVLDFLDLDTRLGIFEGVFFSGSLPHIKPENLEKVLRNIRSVLTDNGYLAIILVDGEGVSSEMSRQVVDGIVKPDGVFIYKR